MEFLNKIINKRQNENSKPAKPKRKKDRENKFKSSFHKPLLIVITYKRIHINSENNNKFKKFNEFIKKINNENQKIIIQKFNHTCI